MYGFGVRFGERLDSVTQLCLDNGMSTTTSTLSAYTVRQYADNLSRFSAESAERQIAAHVERGDFNAADAKRVADVAAFYRRFGAA